MRAFLLGAAALALAACGGSSSDDGPLDPVDPTDDEDPPTPEETTRDHDELATILAAHVRGELALQLKAAEISEMRMPPGFTLTGQTDVDYSGTGVDGAMSYDFVFHCNDGSQNHTIVPCDGTAHHSHIKLTATGSLTVDGMQLDQISRVVDWEIRDITLDKARFRGPDFVAFKTNTATAGESASYSLQFRAVYEQVRFLPAESVPTYGTIDFMINTERHRGSDRRVFNATARLTYGAGATPTTLVIDGTSNYTINLTSGAVVKL